MAWVRYQAIEKCYQFTLHTDARGSGRCCGHSFFLILQKAENRAAQKHTQRSLTRADIARPHQTAFFLHADDPHSLCDQRRCCRCASHDILGRERCPEAGCLPDGGHVVEKCRTPWQKFATYDHHHFLPLHHDDALQNIYVLDSAHRSLLLRYSPGSPFEDSDSSGPAEERSPVDESAS